MKKILFIIIMFLTIFGSTAHAYTNEQAIKAIIGEAEGEGYRGMLAVAGAIRNRHSLRGVYGLHAPRVIHHSYSNNTYRLACKAWRESLTRDITGGATGWGNAKDVEQFRNTSWFPSVYFTAHIGNHYFYGTDG